MNQAINTLSIIIPAYNEQDTIHLILGKIKNVILIKNRIYKKATWSIFNVNLCIPVCDLMLFME